jgi:hypothetical protein
MGSGEIGASEDSVIHLGPPQIELREIDPRQIGRSKIRAAALAPLRFNVQNMRRQELPDLVRRQHAEGDPCRKIDLSGKWRSGPLRVYHEMILLLSAERDTGSAAGGRA